MTKYRKKRKQMFITMSGSMAIASQWILTTGFWNDDGEWIDNAIWID